MGPNDIKNAGRHIESRAHHLRGVAEVQNHITQVLLGTIDYQEFLANLSNFLTIAGRLRADRIETGHEPNDRLP